MTMEGERDWRELLFTSQEQDERYWRALFSTSMQEAARIAQTLADLALLVAEIGQTPYDYCLRWVESSRDGAVEPAHVCSALAIDENVGGFVWIECCDLVVCARFDHPRSDLVQEWAFALDRVHGGSAFGPPTPRDDGESPVYTNTPVFPPEPGDWTRDLLRRLDARTDGLISRGLLANDDQEFLRWLRPAAKPSSR